MSLTPHTLGDMHSLHLGRVTDNVDPDDRGRIKVRLQATPMEVWASVVTLSAGPGYGVACIPRLDEIVVLAFVNPDLPLVIGSLWSGRQSIPEDADAVEDHYVVKTPAGTVVEFDDADGPKLELRTRQGYYVRITESDGGEIEINRGGQSVTLTASDINIQAAGKVTVDAATVEVNAASVQVNAGMSRFSGVVQADTVMANAVVGLSYTPGAGNIW
jgi:uncharacterized protein involved in type VI secretion and phage assembly